MPVSQPTNPVGDLASPGRRQPLLNVRELRVWIRSRRRGIIKAVDDVSFVIDRGEILGLVGESGSGKSMTGWAIMRLLPRNAWIEAGQVAFNGDDLAAKTREEMRSIRGRQIGMILQDPMTSLDPSFTVGVQIGEGISSHFSVRSDDLRRRATESLRMVRMPSPEYRVDDYPHQLSGGMRQRAMSAMALSCDPQLLIADEPTTALDVTVQAQFLKLLTTIRDQTNVGILFISHDLTVIRSISDRVVVMYAGQVVETAPTSELFESPLHPYTAALLGCAMIPGRQQRVEPIIGQPPDPSDYAQGCRFAARCKFAREICIETDPMLTNRSATHVARCWGTEADGWIDVTDGLS